MTLGQESTTLGAGLHVQLNTEQAIVQGVLTSQRSRTCRSMGATFLDLAQLEPGVQIQDGPEFRSNESRLLAISFGGRFGRTARIMWTAVDVSDETVGTTTADIPAAPSTSSQLSQSFAGPFQ